MFRIPRSLKPSFAFGMMFGMMGVVGLLIGTGCTDGPSAGLKQELPDSERSIVGRWRKRSASACSEMYPDYLEFREQYTYTGRKGEERREFTLWDAGEYQVLSENEIKISTATDEEIVYTYTLSDNRLTFVDRQGCRFEYERAD